MDSRIIPVTLALADPEQQKHMQAMIESMPAVRLQPEDAETMGVLVYEPGPSVNEDLPHILQALESGQAEDVYLAGAAPDPDLLIRAMRHGIREFLRYPVAQDDFRAALMRTAMRANLESDGSRGRIVTVLGAKPGMGVTTMAVNLAVAANRAAPGSVALLDLRQPAGDAPLFLDLAPEYTWGDLVGDITRLDATYLRSVMAEHESGLHVLPAPQDATLPDDHELYMILEHLRQAYDLVVVDASISEMDELPKEVELADSLLLVTELGMPALSRTARVLKRLRSLDPDAQRRVRLVVNRHLPDSGVDVGEAEAVLDTDVAWAVPHDYPAALSAMNQGVPMVDAAPRSAASRMLERMAAELAPNADAPRKQAFSLRGLVDRVLRRGGDTATAPERTPETVRAGS
jgi:pilus assembly protein CpaE